MKKFKNVLIIVFLLTTFINCKKEDDNMLVGFNINMDFEISVRDSSGEDLLDPNNPNAYNENEIKIFYLIDGEMVEVYDALMDSPRNFMIYKSESEYRLRVFLDSSTDKTTTYIKWNDSEMDEIKVDVIRLNTYIGYENSQFNGQYVCEGQGGGCFYEYVKN